MSVSNNSSFLQKLWAIGCSLKLAITLASMATMLIMAGSLVMHFNPRIFGGMEQETMGVWLPWAMKTAPLLTLWVPLSGVCVILFALNTLFCLIDWLVKFSRRWRKTGEYLIHTGFILLTIAYVWGNLAGFRSGPHRLFPGESVEIPRMPGYSLHLERFTPQLSETGRPLDMVNQVSLHRDGQVVADREIRINHPLIHDGLVILPTSMGQALDGFRFYHPGRGMFNLAEGSRMPLPGGGRFEVLRLLPDARRTGGGRVMARSESLNNPVMRVAVITPEGSRWEGWYFLREQVPEQMSAAGLSMRPIEPIFKRFSLITINRDPGDMTALAGSLCMALGVILAFFSFYSKRSRGDRPEV